MAVGIENLDYYINNVINSLTSWDILSGAVVSDNNIVISSTGTAGYTLVDSYNNALKASKYRSLSLSIAMSIDQQYNYENYVEIVLKGSYKDSTGKIQNMRKSVNVTLLNSSVTSGVLTLNRVLTMMNYDLINCTVYVINHTTSDITLQSCTMLRSQDINSSQIGESIGFSVAIENVEAYLDGCEIFYVGDPTPTKLWWQQDDTGVFNGVNVDNKRLINFHKNNEILLD